MIQRKSNEVSEQTLTIWEFVAVWAEYVSPRNISAQRAEPFYIENLVDHIFPSSPEMYEIAINSRMNKGYIISRTTIETSDEIKRKLAEEHLKFTETLCHVLMDGQNLKSFPEAQTIEPQPISLKLSQEDEEYVEFQQNMYKFNDLLNWLCDNYDIENKYIPDSIKDILNIKKVPDGFVALESLPKLIQLAINGYWHFDWDSINPNVPSDRYKTKATNYLNEEANNLSLEHLFESNGKLSTKLTDQLRRIINPNNDSPE